MVLTVGQIFGSIFFQFFGQLIGRTMVLASRGIPSAASVILFGYERIFALLVSLGLAGFGIIYLFGTLHFDLAQGGFSLLQIVTGITAAILAGATLAWGRQARRLWHSLNPTLVSRLGWNGVLSIAVQLTTLAAYIVAGFTLAPKIELMSLAAASCVIMFAASLPISFGGWGLREMSAVVVLQAIGFSSSSALVASLLIGLVSLLILAVAALSCQFVIRHEKVEIQPISVPDTPDYTLALDWILPIATVTAVFFQVYLPTGSGFLNVNLADPVAIIGCALYVLRHVRTGWPHWRVPSINAYAIATTLVIVLAFLHGVVVFGLTDWSLVNRVFGWGILFCYVATGALIVERAVHEGYVVFLKTFIATALAITVFDICLTILIHLGAIGALENPRFAGFSQNPNAFAFILLLALAALLTLRERIRADKFLLSLIFVGLWYSASRAAFGAVPVMIIFAVWRGASLKTIGIAAVTASAICALVYFVPTLNLESGSFSPFNELISTLRDSAFAQGRVTSNREHWRSIDLGLKMFAQHPIFGAGLGAFVHDRIREVSVQEIHDPSLTLVIHSTPLWLLAEVGVAGFAVFAAAVFRIVRTELPRRSDSVAGMILLILTAMAVMSSVHEMLFQRAFWLVLGAALAHPIIVKGTGSAISVASPNVRFHGSHQLSDKCEVNFSLANSVFPSVCVPMPAHGQR